jgi:predicted DNA-binding WGR domain protein
MDIILLTRTDARRNMARFYAVSIEPSLFGDCALVRNWGRIGTKGRNRIDLYADRKDADDRLRHIVRIKRRRGYI